MDPFLSPSFRDRLESDTSKHIVLQCYIIALHCTAYILLSHDAQVDCAFVWKFWLEIWFGNFPNRAFSFSRIYVTSKCDLEVQGLQIKLFLC